MRTGEVTCGMATQEEISKRLPDAAPRRETAAFAEVLLCEMDAAGYTEA